jgi:hypothetical protein
MIDSKFVYVSDESNQFILSFIDHDNNSYLAIVDNIKDEVLFAYILDYADSEGLDPHKIIAVAKEWEQTNSAKHPLSIEFSRRGLTSATSRIYKSFDIHTINRFHGKMFKFEFDTEVKIRRRKAIFRAC